MKVVVEVYATKNGVHLGKAEYIGDVSIAQVTKPDETHSQYTTLRNSGETTEKYRFTGTKQIFYGFEYFIQFPKTVVH